MVVIGFSGYAMWFAPFFAHFLPGWALNAVLVIHSEEGLLHSLHLLHPLRQHAPAPRQLSMDMVIFTGVESEEEFKKKRPEEFSGLAGQGKLESRIGTKPPVWLLNFSRVAGTIAILIGLLLLVLTLSAYLRE